MKDEMKDWLKPFFNSTLDGVISHHPLLNATNPWCDFAIVTVDSMTAEENLNHETAPPL